MLHQIWQTQLVLKTQTVTLIKQLGLDVCYTRPLRAALKVTRKVIERRLSAAGHFHRHQEEAAGILVLWDPRHGSPGSRHKIYVQVLLEDAGLENISELISVIEDCNNGSLFTEAYRHDDYGWSRSKWWCWGHMVLIGHQVCKWVKSHIFRLT